MLPNLVRTLATLVPDVADIGGVAKLVRAVTPLVQRVDVLDGGLPWGRYLVHAAENGAWNLQLDVFSPGYVGGVHSHGTWGAFWVLKGALWTENFGLEGEDPRLASAGWVAAGGCEAFFPPASDWHRVGTPATDPQTVSLHLYGSGFDLDVGLALGPEGRPVQYRRGPWGELAVVRGALAER